MKKQTILIGVGLVVVASLAGVVFLSRSANAPDNDTATTQTSDTPAATPTQTASTTLVYTDDGFEPSKITVKVGSVIEIKNNSSRAVQFSSDPHPAHTKNDELNQSTTPAGGSQQFTVTKTGSYGFHNHLNSSHTGTVVVE